MASKIKAPKKRTSGVTRKQATQATKRQAKVAVKKAKPAARSVVNRPAPAAAKPVPKRVKAAGRKAPASRSPAVKTAASKVAARKVLPPPAAVKLAARAPYGLNKPSPVATPSAGTHGSRAKWLTSAEKKSMRAMMLAMRERLARQVGNLKQESLQQREEIVTSEDGTDAFDRQFALTVASSEQDAIFDIDDAIRRLDAGKYGMCEGCGCDIEKLRLKALPFVRQCIRCQSESERNSPRFRPLA